MEPTEDPTKPSPKFLTAAGELSRVDADALAVLHQSPGWKVLERVVKGMMGDAVSTVMSEKTPPERLYVERGRYRAFEEVILFVEQDFPAKYLAALGVSG